MTNNEEQSDKCDNGITRDERQDVEETLESLEKDGKLYKPNTYDPRQPDHDKADCDALRDIVSSATKQCQWQYWLQLIAWRRQMGNKISWSPKTHDLRQHYDGNPVQELQKRDGN